MNPQFLALREEAIHHIQGELGFHAVPQGVAAFAAEVAVEGRAKDHDEGRAKAELRLPAVSAFSPFEKGPVEQGLEKAGSSLRRKVFQHPFEERLCRVVRSFQHPPHLADSIENLRILREPFPQTGEPDQVLIGNHGKQTDDCPGRLLDARRLQIRFHRPHLLSRHWLLPGNSSTTSRPFHLPSFQSPVFSFEQKRCQKG